MEEKRKVLGMEILPSQKKRLKKLAVDTDTPLWQATQEALEDYLKKKAPEVGPQNGVEPDTSKELETSVTTRGNVIFPSPEAIGMIGSALNDQVVIEAIRDYFHRGGTQAAASKPSHRPKPGSTREELITQARELGEKITSGTNAHAAATKELAPDRAKSESLPAASRPRRSRNA